MTEHGIDEATMIINHPNGMCGMCSPRVPTLLPEGAKLTVVPPENVIPRPGYISQPKTIMGNSKTPLGQP